MKRLLVFSMTVGAAAAAFWYFYPRYFIRCESDSRKGEHPALFEIHLRDEIKSEYDVPNSFAVTNTTYTCYLSPEICYYGIPAQKIINDMGPCVIVVCGFDNNVTRVQCFKYYKSGAISEVEKDFKYLCSYVEQHYNGTLKITKNKSCWDREWDLGYDQSITVSYSGPTRCNGGYITVSLQDVGRIIPECNAAKQRGLSNL